MISPHHLLKLSNNTSKRQTTLTTSFVPWYLFLFALLDQDSLPRLFLKESIVLRKSWLFGTLKPFSCVAHHLYQSCIKEKRNIQIFFSFYLVQKFRKSYTSSTSKFQWTRVIVFQLMNLPPLRFSIIMFLEDCI